MMSFLKKETKIQTNNARKSRNTIQLGPMGCLGRGPTEELANKSGLPRLNDVSGIQFSRLIDNLKKFNEFKDEDSIDDSIQELKRLYQGSLESEDINLDNFRQNLLGNDNLQIFYRKKSYILYIGPSECGKTESLRSLLYKEVRVVNQPATIGSDSDQVKYNIID